MNCKACCFSFILYPFSELYDCNKVINELNSLLYDFYFVFHDHRIDGSPCVPHFHCVGRSHTVRSRSYFVKNFKIPDHCILVPSNSDSGAQFYDRVRDYMDNGVL